MPGPCNSKKKRKQQQQSAKERQKSKCATRITVISEPVSTLGAQRDDEQADSEVGGARRIDEGEVGCIGVDTLSGEHAPILPRTLREEEITSASPVLMTAPALAAPYELHPASPAPQAPQAHAHAPTPAHTAPFISDPGNGPRVKDAGAFLASFFCPAASLDDASCAAFARAGVLDVLEAVLPREIALIVWFNKTRKYRRICPACQRLYRLGDALADPISGELVDVYDARTPPQVLQEQQMSGICSSPCFLLASYTSHPYVAEVARGAWGQPAHALGAQTRALLDTTDPATAALMRYGLDAWDAQELEAAALGDLGLGRVLRMTRRADMGIGDVLQALAWAEAGGGREEGVAMMATERDETGRHARGAERELSIRAPVGVRA